MRSFINMCYECNACCKNGEGSDCREWRFYCSDMTLYKCERLGIFEQVWREHLFRSLDWLIVKMKKKITMFQSLRKLPIIFIASWDVLMKIITCFYLPWCLISAVQHSRRRLTRCPPNKWINPPHPILCYIVFAESYCCAPPQTGCENKTNSLFQRKNRNKDACDIHLEVVLFVL